MDHTLCGLSAIRADECIQEFSHIRPDGQSWSSILSDYGYDFWNIVGENLIYGSQGLPVEIIVDTWMSSNAHRENILSPAYLYCGIGLVCNDTTVYIVTIFAG